MESQANLPLLTQPLPYVTADLPGIGGRIKAEPADFVVEELPLYEPAGEGEHVYVRLTREGWATHALTKRLARLFDLKDVDVGCAGLKDKHARATQVISLRLPNLREELVAEQIRAALPVEVLWVRRHRNKLRTGHLLGNRFRVLVQQPATDALTRAEGIARALEGCGLPNFYGVQRFGVEGQNAQLGREALLGRGPRERWLRRLVLSAFQSALFNAWLMRRMGRGWFETLLAGDVAKKTDTGGLFDVEDAEVEAPRFERGEITYTGPIYGSRMRWAAGEPGYLERKIMEEAEVSEEMLRRAQLDGSRRPARLLLSDLRIEPDPAGLVFTFTLPKGAYATTVLREFTKAEVSLQEAGDD